LLGLNYYLNCYPFKFSGSITLGRNFMNLKNFTTLQTFN
jgi:hypothetical protein